MKRIYTDREVWANVVGHKGLYQVSTHGRVRSTGRTVINSLGVKKFIKPKIMTQSLSEFGYLYVKLTMNKRQKNKYVHKLMLEAFAPNPVGKPHGNHKDGDKLHNHIQNLEWVTFEENMRHAYRTGLINRNGEDHHNAKLTESDVHYIRKIYAQGNVTQLEIAGEFGVSDSVICEVVNRKAWKHI